MEYIIDAPGGPYTVAMNQRGNYSPAQAHEFSMGTYTFAGGETVSVSLPLANVWRNGSPTIVIADTVRFQRRSACTHTAGSEGLPCDDGLFCNGAEVCNQGICSADTAPCMQGTVCDEGSDACLLDCNGNGVGDIYDISSGASDDCNGNLVPDECDLEDPYWHAESPTYTPLETGAEHTFSLTGAPPVIASSDVYMEFLARGQLQAPSNRVSVKLNGVGVGDVFGTFAHNYCHTGVDQETLTVSGELFNSLVVDGNLAITLTPSDSIDGLGCSSFIRVAIWILMHDDCNWNGIPDSCEPDCNVNGIPDDCDIAAGVSWDYDGNGVLDECEYDGTVTLELDLKGNQVVGTITHDVTFVFTDCTTLTAQTVTEDVSYSGGLATVVFEHINTQADWVSVDDCISLVAVQQIPWSGTTATVPFSGANILRQGDLDDDNDIDTFNILNPDGGDWGLFVAEWNVFQQVTPPGACGHGDFDGDGLVSFADAAIFLASGVGAGPDRCPGTALRRSFADCNTNGLVDWVEIAEGTSVDCDTNGVPDECQLCGDLDNDYDVDNDDYNLFRLTYGRTDTDPLYNVCVDYDQNGAVGLSDYLVWLSCYRAYQELELVPPGGATLLAGSMGMVGQGASFASPPALSIWMTTASGNEAISALRAGAAYVLQYSSGFSTPQLVVLSMESADGTASMVTVTDPVSGPWSTAGNLAETAGPTCSTSSCRVWSNGFLPEAGQSGGPSGHLFSLTPGGTGEFTLTVWLGEYDRELERWVGASETATYQVIE